MSAESGAAWGCTFAILFFLLVVLGGSAVATAVINAVTK
jgi:hypothetical protein